MWALDFVLAGVISLFAALSPFSVTSVTFSRFPLLESVPQALPAVVNDISAEFRTLHRLGHAGFSFEESIDTIYPSVLSASSASTIEHLEPTRTFPLPSKTQVGLSFFASYPVDCVVLHDAQGIESAAKPTSYPPFITQHVVKLEVPVVLRFRALLGLGACICLLVVAPPAMALRQWLTKAVTHGRMDLSTTLSCISVSSDRVTYVLPEDSLAFLDLTSAFSDGTNTRIKFLHLAPVDEPTHRLAYCLGQDALGISAYYLCLFTPHVIHEADLPPALLVEDHLPQALPSEPSVGQVSDCASAGISEWDDTTELASLNSSASLDNFFADLPFTPSRYGLSLGSELQRAKEAMCSPSPKSTPEHVIKKRERRRAKILQEDSMPWAEIAPDTHQDNIRLSCLH
ncbi:hypothetical protein CERSUDRAFT_125958 [Gelatoporia subvermispora B]|uniref:Uncharacterized protein n=1 Tax=Ceriporiopsis subvermispora (strain B) TaxID=914234 RepID=M2R6A6_CERS8|nr:hypothetical protein CERSUDRAFT_125958 [Gelatoporia subvermispora B]